MTRQPMTIQLPERTNPNPIKLSEHITFQWIHDGLAYHIVVTSSQRSEVDLYINTSLKIIDEWLPDHDFFSIQDISHPDFEMTPYLNGRLKEVLNAMKNSGMKGHSIIVMSDTFTGRIMQALGRFFANGAKPIYQHWITDPSKGMEQLDEYIRQSSQA